MTPRAIPCPACGTTTRQLALARRPHGSVEVDLCPSCRGLWFDAFESTQLTPAATLALFREVALLTAPPPTPRPGPLRCPRCSERLAQTRDVQRTTRFSYWRCGRGHGRFTPFLQFMREKDFVRPLSPGELEQVRAAIGTVRCSGCGAPVDLGRDPACRYCGARVEALDPDAIRRAIARHEQVAAEPTPLAPAEVERWIERTHRRAARSGSPVDLVLDGLDGWLGLIAPG